MDNQSPCDFGAPRCKWEYYLAGKKIPARQEAPAAETVPPPESDDLQSTSYRWVLR